ncbi:hypothetical protein Fmac_011369 [Flemingia macrophylla]|uniref:Uncharacterized protein n=1 Tax=Flemingia macrophylla TaxID=520843 RepID=A0ABD1MM82_9FABA
MIEFSNPIYLSLRIFAPAFVPQLLFLNRVQWGYFFSSTTRCTLRSCLRKYSLKLLLWLKGNYFVNPFSCFSFSFSFLSLSVFMGSYHFSNVGQGFSGNIGFFPSLFVGSEGPTLSMGPKPEMGLQILSPTVSQP